MPKNIFWYQTGHEVLKPSKRWVTTSVDGDKGPKATIEETLNILPSRRILIRVMVAS